MTTRYFKATDGRRTYFRASPTQVYLSLSTGNSYSGWTLHRHANGPFPAVEITRQDYVALTALKVARCDRAKAAWVAANPDKTVSAWAFKGDAPRDSWVDNADLPTGAPR